MKACIKQNKGILTHLNSLKIPRREKEILPPAIEKKMNFFKFILSAKKPAKYMLIA